MPHQATDAERDAMERLNQAERLADEAREHLFEVIRRERHRERSRERPQRVAYPGADGSAGVPPRG
jgi:hypothetical protein